MLAWHSVGCTVQCSAAKCSARVFACAQAGGWVRVRLEHLEPSLFETGASQREALELSRLHAELTDKLNVRTAPTPTTCTQPTVRIASHHTPSRPVRCFLHLMLCSAHATQRNAHIQSTALHIVHDNVMLSIGFIAVAIADAQGRREEIRALLVRADQVPHPYYTTVQRDLTRSIDWLDLIVLIIVYCTLYSAVH